jgi:hypothetical protein
MNAQNVEKLKRLSKLVCEKCSVADYSVCTNCEIKKLIDELMT